MSPAVSRIVASRFKIIPIIYHLRQYGYLRSFRLCGLRKGSMPPLPTPLYATKPINGSITFQKLAEYIAGVATLVSILISLTLIFLHAANCSRPAEQTQIMRIIAAVPVFALVSFGTIFLGESAIYLSPWATLFEAIAILSLFQLLCAYWARERAARYGATVPLMEYDQSKQMPVNMHAAAAADEGTSVTPAQVKRTRLMAIQYVCVAVLVAVITDIMEAVGRYCKGSSSPKFASLWMTIIRTIAVMGAVIFVLRFNKALSPLLRQYKTKSKIWGFKAIVALNVLQNLIFSFIGEHSTASESFAFFDLTVALPGLLSCCEMVIFAVFFHVFYKFTPYSAHHDPSSARQMGMMSALIQAFSPIAVVRDAMTIGAE